MSDTAPRRGNGLHAESYVRISEVAAHLVEGVLDRLGAEGIAAYSAPAGGRRGAYGETVLPATPTDGLWVDRAREGQARALLGTLLATVESDLAFASIVAGFDREPDADPVPRWPVSEDVDDRDEQTDDEYVAAPPTVAVAPPPDPAASDSDDHFVPPPPPPLPRPDTIGRFAWAGAIGGPLVLLLSTLTGIGLADWVGGLALAAFMGGFVTLVARMQDRPPDSGPDDGAVV